MTEALTELIEHHETFRTRFFVSVDGVARQLISLGGHLRVEIRDVGSGDAEVGARAIQDEFNRAPFTIPERSIRAAIVTCDGAPRIAVLCVFHMAMDCWGMTRVIADFVDLMRAKAQGAAPHALDPVSHPVDRALAERSSEHTQRSARGVSYWESELAKFPATAFPGPEKPPESPRFKEFAIQSGSLCVASVQLAAELGVSVASVLLAVAAALLGKRSGNQSHGFVMLSSNRFDEESSRYSGTLVQGVPVTIDLTGAGPRKLIARTHRAGMLGALSALCNPDDLTETVQRMYGREGAIARLSCVANLHLPGPTPGATRPPARAAGAARAQAQELLADSRFHFVEGFGVENSRFYLAAPGNSNEFFVSLRADTTVLSSADIVQFLRDMERSVVGCLVEPVRV